MGKKASFILKNYLEIEKKVVYTVPHKFMEHAKQEIQRLLNDDIIEKSYSNIVSSAFFIEKKNEDLR